MKHINLAILFFIVFVLSTALTRPLPGGPAKTAYFKAVIGKSWSWDSSYCIGTAGTCSLMLRPEEDTVAEAGIARGEMQFTEGNQLCMRIIKNYTPADLQALYFNADQFYMPQLQAISPDMMEMLGRPGEIFVIQPGSYSIQETPEYYILTF